MTTAMEEITTNANDYDNDDDDGKGMTFRLFCGPEI